MDSITLNLKDKPYLQKAMFDYPELAKEVIGTFAALMEEAFDPKQYNGTRWVDLPKEFHRDLRFGDLIRGVLRGSLDLPKINPDTYDALKAEVHPLSMLSPRKNYLTGGMKYHNWRGHFRLPEDTIVSEETIAEIFRKMLRYAKYIKFDDLAHAIESNQIVAFRGMGDRAVQMLPMFPALKYQRDKLGELLVGTFISDIGALDCGTLPNDTEKCPACSHPTLSKTESFAYCLDCNAGFRLDIPHDM